MAYVCALFGNLWALVNPWNVLFEGADRLYGAVQPGRRLGFGLAYPSWLGVWLACLLFLAFAWAELVWPARAEPSSLAIIILIYSAITWAGMLLFGRAAWLAGGEPFSVAFGLISRFAPLDAQSAHELNLRPPAAGLIADPPASPSADRVRAPSPRHRHLRRLQGNACLGIARGRIDGPWTARSPPGDVGITDLFTAVLGVVSRHLLVDVAHRRQRPHDGGYGGAFRYHSGANRHRLPSGALSFVPADQRPIDDSDPFGFGWGLFGTADYRADIAVVGAKFTWYTALAAIVVGYIVAVALRIHGDGWTAMRSQYPMLALMIGYTIVGLWILSQPLV